MQTCQTKIAVVGIGCRYPGATTPRELWENILAKRRQFRRIPDVRLPLGRYYDADRTVPDKTYGSMAALLDGYEFDWSGHRIPRSAYEATDIVHWLALDVALQMLADAKYSADRLPGASTQVIVGNSLTGEFTRSNSLRLRWPFVENVLEGAAARVGLPPEHARRLSGEMEVRFKEVFPAITEDSLAGGLSNTIAGRICNYLNLNGGGYTVDGACSSSLIAVYTGASHLDNRTADFVIAGGVDVSLDPFELVGFAKTGALTATEMSVYDKGGNGFLPGEGCGFVGLKRLDDARRDGDTVYAILDGWGMSSDGKGGITAPSVNGQSLALERAYRGAGIAPSQLEFIEGHGTGTAVGDRTELLGIAKALSRPDAPLKRSCGVTSLKSVIGHTKAAAGIGAFIKAVIAVNQRTLPPTAGCVRPHDAFFREATALYPLVRGTRLPAGRQVRAGVSAMGFGGINVHVTLTSADAALPALEPAIGARAALASAQDDEVVCLSAPSEAGLLARLAELREDAQGASLAELADLAASVNRKSDSGYPFRAAVVGGSPRELTERVDDLVEAIRGRPLERAGFVVDPKKSSVARYGTKRLRIGFLFPGQGSQQVHMARPLVERFDWAQALVANADRWAAELGTSGLADNIYGQGDRLLDPSDVESAADRLKETRLAQPAIVLGSLIWSEYLRRVGIEADVLLGHSLGELTAFFASGAFDEKTLVQLATVRGQLMAAPIAGVRGAMLSLACNAEDAGRAIGEVEIRRALVVANLNSSTQTVVSGDWESIEALREVAKRRGLPSQLLRVSNAYHSPLVEEAAVGIREFTGVPRHPVRLDKALISSCDGELVSADLDLRDHFPRQITTRVNFVRALDTLRAEAEWAIEVGPGRALSGLANGADAHLDWQTLPVESRPDSSRDLNWALAMAHANGVAIRWDRVYENRVVRPFKPARELRFLVNPCERTPPSSARAERVVSAPSVPAAFPTPAAAAIDHRERIENAFATLAERTAKVTGFAVNSIDRGQRLLDDLNLDSIKVSLVIGESCVALGVDVPENPAGLASLSLGEVAARLALTGDSAAPSPATPAVADGHSRAAPPATPWGQAEVEDLLLTLAARHTSFDRSTLDASASFTDDLNLDSIKVAALLAEAEATIGVEAGLGPGDIAGSTIRDVAIRLCGYRQKPSEPAPATPVSTPSVAASPSVAPATTATDDGVGCFAMRLLPAKREGRKPWPWSGQVVAIQCDDSERPLAAALATQFESLGAKTVTFNPASLLACERTDFRRMVIVLPRCVLFGANDVSLVSTSVRRLRAAAVVSARQRECESLAYLQFGGFGLATSGSSASFPTACVSGFAASVHLERPSVRVRVLDLHPGIDARAAVRCLVDESSGGQAFALIHYDRELRRFAQVPQDLGLQTSPPRNVQWNHRDVVLVTGGGKGITAECALAFARATQVRLLLVGSSPSPGANGDTEIARTLSRCAEAGVFARYHQCDIVDRGALAQLLDFAGREYGPISGVIHGAALNRPKRVEQVDEAAAVAEVAPKLTGLLNLCELLRASPPKLFIAMSSIIGVTGMPGNAWYAFSNEAATACLARFKVFHPDTAVAALAYSVWSDVGMAAKMGSDRQLAKQGVASLSPATGAARFLDAALRDSGALQIVIAGALGGLDTWCPPAAPRRLSGRFLENLVTFEPGVQVVARTRLTLEEDPYLKDHLFRGVHLFPTVFGLEAMAQCVAKATGAMEFRSLKVVDVELTRPIVVSSDKGAEIEVRARVAKGADGQGTRRVHVGIATDQTSFKRDHFSATFVIESPPLPSVSQLAVEAKNAALDLDPRRHLYGGFLFQGPTFQLMDRIWRMGPEGSFSRARQLKPPAYFGSGHPQGLVLGDPLLRDALLQSAQLSERCTVLPIGIDEIDLYDLGPRDGHAWIRTEVKHRTAMGPTCEVLAEGADGRPIERLSGYRLKRMEQNEGAPEPADWANPEIRDASTVSSLVAERSAELGLVAPQSFSRSFLICLRCRARSGAHWKRPC